MKKLFFTLLLIMSLSFDSLKAANPASEEEYKKGMEAGKSGNLNGAVDFFTKAIQADPQNFMAYFDRGGAHEALKNKEKAAEDYAKAFEIKPEFAEAATEAGTIYLLDKNDPAKALELFKKALLVKNPYIDPRFPINKTRSQILRNVSVAYAISKKYGVAKSVAQSYLANKNITHEGDSSMQTMVRRTTTDMAPLVARNFANELSVISKMLHGQNNPAEALKKYLEFEKAHPVSTLTAFDQWDLYLGIALSYAMKTPADIPSSIPYFEKATAASQGLEAPLLIESHFNLACSLSEVGEAGEALKELETVLWYDTITANDSFFKSRKTPKIFTDETLGKVRQSPGFKELVEKYKGVNPFL